jgi:hypothetical protein
MFVYSSRGMEKENGEGVEPGKQPAPPDGLLDAAGLFGGEPDLDLS